MRVQIEHYAQTPDPGVVSRHLHCYSYRAVQERGPGPPPFLPILQHPNPGQLGGHPSIRGIYGQSLGVSLPASRKGSEATVPPLLRPVTGTRHNESTEDGRVRHCGREKKLEGGIGHRN